LTKPNGESFLGFLQHVADGEVGNPEHATVQVGAAAIRQTVVTASSLLLQKMGRSSSGPDVSEFKGEGRLSMEKDHERESAWQQVSHEVAFLTPSSRYLSQAPQPQKIRRGSSKVESQRLGTLVHRLLEQWDFKQDSESFREPLREFCRQALRGDLDEDEKNAVILEIERLMETFLHSPSYRELQQATVIGREIPFVMPWSNEEQYGSVSRPCVMEGVMDVVYELAGNLWIGDYKTDMVTASNVVEYAGVYRQQAQVYAIAASRSLGVDVKGCQLFFLRIGESVSIMRDIAKFS
jgi:ATP-dependent helicase/nuclease subunit A